MTQERNRAAAETGQAGDDRLILAKRAVAGQRRHLLEHRAGIVEKMRAFRMARHQHLLPGRQMRIGVADKLLGARREPRHIAVNIHGRIIFGELSKLDDLAFQFRDGTFEIQVMHGSLI